MNKLFLALITFTLPILALAEQGPQDLLATYRQAQASDPLWAAAQNENLAAQEIQVQGKALTLPTVTLAANAKHSDTDIRYRSGLNEFGVRSAGDHGFETYDYGVNVTQPLYRKQNSIQYQQSKVQVMQADTQLDRTRQNLMIRVAQAYFDELLAQDKIDLIQAEKAAIGQQLEQAKASFEVGTITIVDVNEAQARFDLILAQEIAAINDLEEKKRSIMSLTGQVPMRLVSAKSDLQTALPEPREMERWVEMAEQNNHTLKIQLQALEIATQQVDYAKAGHLPTLDVVGSYADARSTGGINGVGNDLKDFTVGVQFQLPLYQGGAITSKEREAVANKLKTQDEVEFTRRQAGLQARQAYLRVSTAVAEVKALEQAVLSSKSQLESTNLGFEVGVRTSIDVLNAQQQYYTAQYNLLQARYSWLLNVLKLKAAAGVLGENDMVETNSQLQGS